VLVVQYCVHRTQDTRINCSSLDAQDAFFRHHAGYSATNCKWASACALGLVGLVGLGRGRSGGSPGDPGSDASFVITIVRPHARQAGKNDWCQIGAIEL
jgi:hypothetical protein